MVGWKALGPGAQAAVVAAGVAVAAGAGWLVLRPEAGDPVPMAAVPEAVPAPATAAAPAEAATPTPPSFDTVRVESDGAALVAGRALAGADVSIRVDGAEVLATVADGQGGFAAMFNLPTADTPRLLTLVMRLPDGTELASRESVALAPTTAPAALAAAEIPEGAETTAVPQGEAPAPAALLLTDLGAQVLQSGEPELAEVAAATPVVIDAITYTPEGAVQLGGKALAGAALRLYLDNAAVQILVVPATGLWATTLPDIAPGLYTLRADQLDAAGKVTSRFETPFKRETIAALAAAIGTEAAPEAIPAETSAGTAAATPAAAEPVTQAETTATATEATPDATAPTTQPDAVASAKPAPEPVLAEVPAALAPPRPVSVTVQPGFTLWRIAQENFGEGVMYVLVYEANSDKIRDPDLIYPGQVFMVPQPPAAAQTAP